jgi:hypothetical protein
LARATKAAASTTVTIAAMALDMPPARVRQPAHSVAFGPPFGEQRLGAGGVVLSSNPLRRGMLARPDLKSGAKGGSRLLQVFGAVLALVESGERATEVALSRGCSGTWPNWSGRRSRVGT